MISPFSKREARLFSFPSVKPKGSTFGEKGGRTHLFLIGFAETEGAGFVEAEGGGFADAEGGRKK